MKNRFSGSAFFDSQMPFVAADNFFAQAFELLVKGICEPLVFFAGLFQTLVVCIV